MIKKLSYSKFIKSFRDVPRIGISLYIKDGQKILLAQRANTPYRGYWHLPGSFLLKGEKIQHCLERIAQEELGIKLDGHIVKFITFREEFKKDPRGHIIEMVYQITLTWGINLNHIGKNNKQATWWDKNSLPARIGFGHKDLLGELS